MKSTTKKVLSLLIALVMLAGTFPGAALAADPVTYPYDDWTVTDQSAAAEDTVIAAGHKVRECVCVFCEEFCRVVQIFR